MSVIRMSFIKLSLHMTRVYELVSLVWICERTLEAEL